MDTMRQVNSHRIKDTNIIISVIVEFVLPGKTDDIKAHNFYKITVLKFLSTDPETTAKEIIPESDWPIYVSTEKIRDFKLQLWEFIKPKI